MNGKPLSCENMVTIKEKIEAIPDAMRKMGWNVSADLMQRWIHSPAWVMPEAWKKAQPETLPMSHMDQDIVRMNWAMANQRVRIAMNELRTRMHNGPAKALLRKRLAGLSWGADNRATVGSRQHKAVHLDLTCQSNASPFGGKLNTMDDLYGGLGNATLKVALIGDAMRDARTGGLALQVTHAGFYIRDTYDFNGFQYLGTWTKSGVLSKAQMLMNTLSDGIALGWGDEPIGNVFNHDFDMYRCTTGFGGDFVIYSDVYWEPADILLDLS